MKNSLMVFLLLSSVIFNSFSLNNENINNFKKEIKSEVMANNIFSYSTVGLTTCFLGYLAFKQLTAKKPSNAFVYPNFCNNADTLNNICNDYNAGILAKKEGYFKTVISSIPLMVAQYQLTNSCNFFQKRLFKKFDINWVVQEKSKIQLIFSNLKKNFAILDTNSEMFNLIVFPVMMPEEQVARSLSPEFFEIFRLKTIAIASKDLSQEKIVNTVNEATKLLNNLTTEFEKIIGFMLYQSDIFKAYNNIDAAQETDSLIESLKELINGSYLKMQAALDKIETKKEIEEGSNLLTSMFEFSREFYQIAENLRNL